MCTMMMMIITSKSGVDEHFPEVVWVAGHGEQAVSDETLPGAEDKVLLDIRGVVQPDAQDVHSQDHSQLTRGGLIILKRINNVKVNYLARNLTKYKEYEIHDLAMARSSSSRAVPTLSGGI